MPPEPDSHQNHPIVLYDGLCGLCDGVVQFLLRHDTSDVFRFAPQQSEFAQQVLFRHGFDATATETICLVEDYGRETELVLTKSDATLRIAERLGGIWNGVCLARILPRSLRDAAYDWVARNRFRFFGRRTECRMASAAERHRFLA